MTMISKSELIDKGLSQQSLPKKFNIQGTQVSSPNNGKSSSNETISSNKVDNLNLDNAKMMALIDMYKRSVEATSNTEESEFSDQFNGLTSFQIYDNFLQILKLIEKDNEIFAALDDRVRIKSCDARYKELVDMIKALLFKVNELESKIQVIETQINSDVKMTPFSVTFNTLDQVDLEEGVWNESLGRLEF